MNFSADIKLSLKRLFSEHPHTVVIGVVFVIFIVLLLLTEQQSPNEQFIIFGQ